MRWPEIARQLDLKSGQIAGAPRTERRLSDLAGCYLDEEAWRRAVAAGDPVVYTVSHVEPGIGEGELHYGLGMLLPGRVGREYFMTKGHFHTWREAAELYIGLRGHGGILLQNERTGHCRWEVMGAESVVYVPGYHAHRTINTGAEPFVYLGVYPAGAGHDYAALAARHFDKVVLDRDGRVEVVERTRAEIRA